MIHTYLGRLRGQLRPHGLRIITRGDGYALEPDQHTIDTVEFVALANQATAASDPGTRVALYDRALALWRGPLLADLVDDRLRQRLGADLAELRLSSSELRAGYQLEMGLHDRVITDLTPLTAQYPTRERLVAYLMTGLHRAARRTDALQLYRTTGEALARELGIRPGSELRTLRDRILHGDPRLDRPPAPVYSVRVRDQWLPWQVSGHPALEFCNTYAGWGGPPTPGSDWLRDYATLAVWAGHLDLADDQTVARLLRQARESPADAAAVLDSARVLRANLYTCLTRPDDVRAFEAVARFAEAAAKWSVFVRDTEAGGLGRWRLSPAAGLRLPVYAAAHSGADLLADPRRHTVRACPNPECGWLFLDQGGHRRWCSQTICGIGSRPPTADDRATADRAADRAADRTADGQPPPADVWSTGSRWQRAQ